MRFIVDDLDASPLMVAKGLDRPKANLQGLPYRDAVIRWFASSPLPERISFCWTGRKVGILLERCMVRRQLPSDDGHHVPWHMDANFVGFGHPMFTVWIPLVDVGETAPGLEFVDHGLERNDLYRQWALLTNDDRGRRVFQDDKLEEALGEHTIETPKLKVGQCLVFDQTELHRTQHLPEATNARWSIDLRVVRG